MKALFISASLMALAVNTYAQCTVSAGPDKTVCQGITTVIGAPPQSGATYNWTPDNDLNNAKAPQPVANPRTSTTYTVVITFANGCTASDAIVVSIRKSPMADAGPDRVVCQGQKVTVGTSQTGAPGDLYYWQTNDGKAAGTQENIEVSPSVTTTYTVRVSNTQGCSAADDVIVTVQACAGISSPELASKIKLSPNPASTELSIHLQDKSMLNAQAEIRSLNGQLLHRQELSSMNTTVDIGKLPQGLYFLIVNTIEGNTATLRFAKNTDKK